MSLFWDTKSLFYEKVSPFNGQILNITCPLLSTGGGPATLCPEKITSTVFTPFNVVFQVSLLALPRGFINSSASTPLHKEVIRLFPRKTKSPSCFFPNEILMWSTLYTAEFNNLIFNRTKQNKTKQKQVPALNPSEPGLHWFFFVCFFVIWTLS